MDILLAKALQQIPEAQPRPSWLDSQAEVFIYGTGTVARDVFRVLSKRSIPVSGFLDHRPGPVSPMEDIPIYAPGAVQLSRETREHAWVLLAIHNQEVNMPVLLERLSSLGYRHFVSMVELYDHFSSDLGTRYWLTGRNYYRSQGEAIERAHRLFSDQASRDLFTAILRYRITGEYSLLPPPDLQSAYFPADLPAWRTPLRLVDCGAYEGDTIASFLKAGFPLEAVAAFEPDALNFTRLAGFVRDQGQHLPDIALWPCGVFSSTVQSFFDPSGKGSSAIVEIGDKMIQCVSLDEAIPTFAPNLIKMDIEGAECEALIGAQRLIAASRPGLAIATYHTPSDHWQIPILVDRIARECHVKYDYFLRSHAYNSFETVFYAIPSSGSGS